MLLKNFDSAHRLSITMFTKEDRKNSNSISDSLSTFYLNWSRTVGGHLTASCVSTFHMTKQGRTEQHKWHEHLPPILPPQQEQGGRKTIDSHLCGPKRTGTKARATLLPSTLTIAEVWLEGISDFFPTFHIIRSCGGTFTAPSFLMLPCWPEEMAIAITAGISNQNEICIVSTWGSFGWARAAPIVTTKRSTPQR